MQLKGIKLSRYQKRELEKFRNETKNAKESRIATGVLMRAQGKSGEEVAKSLGISERQVFKWCNKYHTQGIAALKAKKQTGRPAIKGNKAKKIIPEILKKSPKAFGFLKGRWVVRDIAKVLRKEGIEISFQQTHLILKDLEYTLKQPQLRAPGSIKKKYAKRRQIRNYQRIAGALKKNTSS